MKTVKINDIILSGDFFSGLRAGLTKNEIEKVLEFELGQVGIETDDLDLYYVEIRTGLSLAISFDKNSICFNINLDLEENRNINMNIEVGGRMEKINEDIDFEKLIYIISQLNIDWEFDRRRVYFQTVCLDLKNGLRMLYAFGDKKTNDYGLFSIKSVLEGHPYTP